MQHDDKIKSSFTGCPASTERETMFNDNISITGKSIFLRNANGSEENITLNICDHPIEPAMVYNSKNHKYEIGYEVGMWDVHHLHRQVYYLQVNAIKYG